MHVQLDARKVMKGITATSDEVKDSVQAAGTAWNFQRCPWNQTESSDTGDICQIKILESVVVR